MGWRPSYYRKSDNCRIWVDGAGTGSVRILRRINFRVFIGVFKEMLAEIRKTNPEKVRIIIYIAPSINDDLSDNVKEFIEFCRDCIEVDFEVVILE